jgi:hypothetical protein
MTHISGAHGSVRVSGPGNPVLAVRAWELEETVGAHWRIPMMGGTPELLVGAGTRYRGNFAATIDHADGDGQSILTPGSSHVLYLYDDRPGGTGLSGTAVITARGHRVEVDGEALVRYEFEADGNLSAL